jgi:hypothetical protein
MTIAYKSKFSIMTDMWFDLLVKYTKGRNDKTIRHMLRISRMFPMKSNLLKLDHVLETFPFSDGGLVRRLIRRHIHAILDNTFKDEFRHRYNRARPIRTMSCTSQLFSLIMQAITYYR